MKPLVSVIVPLYNAAPFIGEALDSIMASTYRPIEIIVVDDGSTDKSLSIAQQYADKHPEIVVLSQPNAGASAARNKAIRSSHGTYILPVDADNKIHPLYIEEAVQVLEHQPEVRVVSCRAEFFGVRTGEWSFPPFSKALLARKNMIDTCAMYRRADWNKTPGYIETCAAREDWDLWLSLFEQGGNFVRLPDIRLYYRVRTGSKRVTDRKLKHQLIDEINRRHPAYMEQYLGGPLHYHRSLSRFLNRFRSVRQVGAFERWREGEIIDSRRNILRITEGVVVKQFRTPCMLRGLWYGLFGISKARRSYENALRLKNLTPAPIAYREVRICGILRESWYACRLSECTHTFQELIEQPAFPQRNQILRAIGRFTAQLRQMGVWHRDYSQGNILFNEDGSRIEVIDLNRIRWRKNVPGKPFERLERIGQEGLKILQEGYESV
jgi:glycosyltransferase involved in cell wall biosynthesis